MGQFAEGAGRPGVDLEVGRRRGGGVGREFVEAVKCSGSVEQFKEEGSGCLAVDFGGERLGGHCLIFGEW